MMAVTDAVRGPRLTRSSIAPTVEAWVSDADGGQRAVLLPGEYPLTLYVDRRELVTLMTLGQLPEALAIGYLRNQRLVSALSEIVSVDVDWEVSAAAVVTRDGIAATDLSRRTVTSGCGQGTMFGEVVDGLTETVLERRGPLGLAQLRDILAQVRALDTVYKAAGAVHGCGLFAREGEGAELLLYVEDIGRHNAVDAIAGWMWLNGVDGSDKVFYTTGRLTSEMVIKCAQIRVPFLVSRSGTTRMGHEVARQAGLTMVGRAVGRRHLVLSGAEHMETGTAAAGRAA